MPFRKPQVLSAACPNAQCAFHGRAWQGKFVEHSYQRQKSGRRPRHRCKACGTVYCSTTDTAYHRLRRFRRAAEWVVVLCVKEMSLAAIVRLTILAWNTVARWLKVAARSASAFHDDRLRNFELTELRTEEMRTFVPDLTPKYGSNPKVTIRDSGGQAHPLRGAL